MSKKPIPIEAKLSPTEPMIVQNCVILEEGTIHFQDLASENIPLPLPNTKWTFGNLSNEILIFQCWGLKIPPAEKTVLLNNKLEIEVFLFFLGGGHKCCDFDSL